MQVSLRYFTYISILYRLLIQKIQLLVIRATYTTNNTILFLRYLLKIQFPTITYSIYDFEEEGVQVLSIKFVYSLTVFCKYFDELYLCMYMGK